MAKRMKYSEEDMRKALDAAQDGVMSVRKASAIFGVPKTTLIDKLKGRVPIERKIGIAPILTSEEEGHLVTWILGSAKAGFPITKMQLTDSVQLLIRELKRENPFPNDRPQRHWHEGFMKRHPEIVQRVAQNLSGQRANVSEEKIRGWFTEVFKYLKETGYETILEDPSRIFNCDETAMFLCPKSEKVYTEKGQKTVYAVSNNDEKECLTTLMMCNAAGQLAPPMIMFSYKRIPKSIAEKIPKNWAVGKSENGWMTGESFFEYVANIFLVWLTEKQIERPVILFVDGHTSHLTMQLSQFCSKSGIVLISLYPNSTHILQPLDVGVFRPLKLEWKRAVVQWRVEHNGAKLSKEHFAPLLNTVVDNMKNRLPNIIQKGFATSGLYPFSADNIKYEKFFKTLKGEISTSNRADGTEEEVRIKVLNFFEKQNAEKINNFKSSGNIWQGKVEDTNLFYFWQSLQHKPLEVVGEGGETAADHHLLTASPTPSSLNEPSTSQVPCDIMPQNIEPYAETNENEDPLNEWPLPPINEFQDREENNSSPYYDIVEEITKAKKILFHTDNDDVNNSIADLPLFIDSTTNINVTSNDLDLDILNNSTFLEETEALCRNDDDTFLQKENADLEVNEETNATATVLESNNNQNLQALHKTPLKTSDQDELLIQGKGKQSDKENLNVPTPFKKALFWKSESEENKTTNKRKPKEKVPAVASSQQWQEYHKRKEEKKATELKEKEERKKQRLEKLRQKEEEKKQKKLSKMEPPKKNEKHHLSSESDNSSSNSENESIELDIGDHVIIKYDDAFFPGLVIKIEKKKSEEEYTVKAMAKSGTNWKWPKTDDILNYQKKDILAKILKPKLLNKRGTYEVPEMLKF